MFGLISHSGLKYEIIVEYASLLLAVLLLIFMILTKPRKTKAFGFLLSGTIVSIIATLTQIIIVQVGSNVGELYERTSFTALLVFYLILYAIILVDIFNYINLMSERRLRKRSVIAALYIAISVVYATGAVFQVMMRTLFYVRTDGVDISRFIRFYCLAGIFCAVVCLVICQLRKKDISRIVMRGVMLVVPIEIIVLILQMFDRYAIYSSATYVIIFMSFYLLFHSNPYDEATGCQNVGAMESRFTSNIRKGKVYYLASFEFPQIAGTTVNYDYQTISFNLAETCREIERISKKILLYRMSYGSFVAIIEARERSDAENYAEQMRDALDRFYEKSEDHIHYFLGVCGDSKRFETLGNKWTQIFMAYLRSKYSKDGENVYYFAKGSDFRDFDEIYKIEQAVMDIRAKMDPDDERILCYAQPIFSVEKEEFRSAEALMRLEIDGKMIPPDVFIPIAERNNCIHALTVIMMHKVCRAVEALAAVYDFDAITINCSTADFVNRKFHKEIMDIIHSYKIDQKMIRLELTETMMTENFEAVRHNMEMLNMEGIQLYMDDFGTGYSNLERVLDIPVQTIKFDKSLLYKSLQDERVDDIISYMIDIFKKNGFITLIEGVENESQKNYSINRGFDYIQGYHYAKPAPIEALGKYFTKK